MSNPTIYDVARKAGVGIGTVSRVLNSSPRVSEATRKKVIDAINALGFKPNSSARRLSKKTKLHNIGVITQPFNSYHSFVERLRGVQSALGELEADYELILYNVSTMANFGSQLKNIIANGSVEALLFIDLFPMPEQREELQTVNIPFVGINHAIYADWPCIVTDNTSGGYMATSHLLELGHRKIAYIGDAFISDYGFTTSQRRYQGYVEALNEKGIPIRDDFIWLGPHGYETAKKLMSELLAELAGTSRPTAIFAMSDMQALGCIAAIREAGLRVPEDISVIGYDNLELATYSGLTTVDQYLELSGYTATQYLLELMKDADAVSPPLPSLEVIVRETTQALTS